MSFNHSVTSVNNGSNHGGRMTSDGVPKKYVRLNGIMQLNPEWKEYKAKQNEPATTAKNPEKALPVVTNLSDYAEYNEAAGTPAPLAESTNMTIEMMQEKENCDKVGINSENLIDELGAKFAKYEIPMGLMNKLMFLSEYDELEMIVDDSGSMGGSSDAKTDSGRTMTRWEEAKDRIKSMMEILAYIPTPPIKIHFFNRRDTIDLQRGGETPEAFINRAHSAVERAFSRGPSGGTPAREKLAESFQKGAGKRVSRYFFCDGTPNGGKSARTAISDMVKNRKDPEGNPLTFLSCTNVDSEAEWMKEVEEVATYCSEYDDFNDEADEVLKDQGEALPYTKGFHLVAQLIGAMCPDDLDAMDESVPFTKFTLDNLLGVVSDEASYRSYFDGFVTAQDRRRPENAMDRVKKSIQWQGHYNEFLQPNKSAKDLPVVADFKAKLKAAAK